MTKRVLSPEHIAAMQAGRVRAREEKVEGKEGVGDGLDDDATLTSNAATSKRNTLGLIAAGMKKGVGVTILPHVGPKKLYAGKRGEVVGMNWAEGEVQVKMDGESRTGWFRVGEMVKV